MQFKIAICDDEAAVIDTIEKKLSERSNEYEICRFSSGEELLDASADYHILFLDIEMTGIDGMQTAFRLREKNYDGLIIFLTSHTEFMPEAFKVNAFRFLDKPIADEKFNEAFAAAEKDILNTAHILIKTKISSIYVKLTDIVLLEAYGDGTYIYDKNGNIYDTDNTLKFWKEAIGTEHFFQVHKSYIVSFLHVSRINKDGTIMLSGYSKELSASRRNYAAFKNAFFDYIKKHARIM
ncbi:MAG: response regulator transcription factor [Oscillospiraceae bacterium]|nr:response regulator transcription factor [Oscillospiraceae bacterium]